MVLKELLLLLWNKSKIIFPPPFQWRNFPSRLSDARRMTPVRIFRFWKTYVICHFVGSFIFKHPNTFHYRRPSKRAGWSLFFVVVTIPGLSLNKTNKNALMKKKRKVFSYLMKFRRDRLQSHIWLTASSYTTKYSRICSYTLLEEQKYIYSFFRFDDEEE